MDDLECYFDFDYLDVFLDWIFDMIDGEVYFMCFDVIDEDGELVVELFVVEVVEGIILYWVGCWWLGVWFIMKIWIDFFDDVIVSFVG